MFPGQPHFNDRTSAPLAPIIHVHGNTGRIGLKTLFILPQTHEPKVIQKTPNG
jgi:hypothetical protein